jgi:hypothetical protein
VAERASRRAEKLRFIDIDINIPRDVEKETWQKATGSMRSIQPCGVLPTF